MPPFARGDVAAAIPFAIARMSNTQPPRRSASLCALAVASAFALGGCSFLQKIGNTPQAETTEAGGTPAEQLFAGGTPAEHNADSRAESPKQGEADEASGKTTTADTQDDADAEAGNTWNLATLKAAEGIQAKQPLTLERAWYMAVQNDPDYQAALAARAAAQTEIRLGRAAILPQVQAGYSRSKITGLQRNFAANGTMREGELNYDSSSAYIQLQQPLFNLDRYATYKGGHARAQLGEAEFAMQEYEAVMRLVTAYLDAVESQGKVKLARGLARSLEEQAKTQEALFELNEASRVDAQETRARLAIAKADVIAAEDELRVARRRLEAIIGQEPPPLASLDKLSPAELSNQIQQSLLQWLERGQANGPAVRVAQAQVIVADTEVTRAVARHLPTADLVVAYIDADSENLDTLSQRSNTFQVGVNVNIPLYSGGYDTANHARSRHERQQSEHELAEAREQTAAEITRQYTAVQGGAQRIEALMASVESAEQSLEAARKGYEYGVASNLDVLRRQDSLFNTRMELLSARRVAMEARIALAAAAGESVMSALTHTTSFLSY